MSDEYIMGMGERRHPVGLSSGSYSIWSLDSPFNFDDGKLGQ